VFEFKIPIEKFV